MARFEETYCSQCGGEFGPGDSGFSHCDQHKGRMNFDGLRPDVRRAALAVAAREQKRGCDD